MRSICPTGLRLKAAFACGLGAAVLVASVPARAGDDDVPIDTQIVRSIMEGIGLKSGREHQINYQERAPLVIPPSKDLPPPQNAGTAIANNPAWPKDPDVARAKLAREQEKNRDIQAEIEREKNPLPPDQLAPGPKPRRTPTSPSQTATGPSVSDTEHYRMTPSDLGYHGGLFGSMFSSKDDSENAKFTGEPKRTSLTDPPSGYQTPSPDQPYGLGGKAAAPKPTQYYTTKGEVNSDSR